VTATCPAGHLSTTDDYCDTCGAPISATPTAPPASPEPAAPPPPPPPEPAAVACPNCGEQVEGQFCESCGYDVVAGAPAAAGSTVTLAVGADRGHWDRMVGSGEPAFPDVAPTLTFELTGDHATLGRVRPGRAQDVDLGLSGAAADPAASAHQCEFTRDPDTGTWSVRDSGSANGTWINDATEPLPAGQAHTLAAGDRIFVGAWTCLTVSMN
jgi:FHA domain